MAAKDYKLCISAFLHQVYLAKVLKNKYVMSTDRREVTDDEILMVFENYLRRYCKEYNTDTVTITNNGKKIFSATLIDKETEK